MQAVLIVVGVIIGALILLALGVGGVIASFIPLWINAKASGVYVSPFQMLGMKLRGLDPAYLIKNMIELHKTGIATQMDDLEAHVLAGGDLEAVVEAGISADKAGLEVTFDQVCAIDLAGRDVVQAVESCVDPIVISVPPIQAVAQDGIRVRAAVRVTARSRIDRLVGGAGPQTIVARVGEGVVTAIGRMERHAAALENPERISAFILERGLDAGTALEIVSVDVYEVDVLDNVGAQLSEVQAESDKLVAQARAEGRRAIAEAQQMEMRARVTDMTSQVTANEADVPLAMAAAARAGRMWRSPHPVHSVYGTNLWDVLDS